VEQLRVEVYRTFAQTGRPPTVDELADEVAGETTEVRAALRQLARGRHLSLDVDDAIVMAHPFSAVPPGFSVMSNDTLWWADVPGTPSPCRICSVSYCPAPHRSWSRPRARPATVRTSGASTAAALPMESRSRTSWSRPRTCGMTWCTPAPSTAVLLHQLRRGLAGQDRQ